MMRGCVITLIALFGGYYLELYLLGQIGLGNSTILAAILALGLAMMVGAVHGTFYMRNRGLGADGTTETLEEGKKVRVSGQLSLLSPAVVSPVSNRGVAAYSYWFESERRRADEPLVAANILRGVGMSACEVVTKRGRFRLEGSPSLEHFPEAPLDSGTTIPILAKRLGTHKWTEQTGAAWKDFSLAEANFGSDGGVEDFLNRGAVELFPSRQDERAITEKLREFDWSGRERILVPGAHVTAQGTYYANPPRIRIDKSLGTIDHQLHPGDGAEVAGGEMRTQWIGMVVFLAMGAGLHAFMYLDQGRYSKALLAWIRSLE